MKVSEIIKNVKQKHTFAVIYGGRFQPFHKGHYAIYKRLIKEFGPNSVWITMSGKVSKNEGSPFSFNERKSIISSLFDIDESKIIKTKSSPIFSISEVLSHYHTDNVTVILVTGEKDKERFKNVPEYDSSKTLSEKVYMYSIDNHVKTTATEIRKVFSNIKDEDIKHQMKHYFGKYDYAIGQLIKERCTQ